MNNKRNRSKNRRAGCLLCKPHKMNGAKNKTKAKYVITYGDTFIPDSMALFAPYKREGVK